MQTDTPPDETKPVRSSRPEQVSPAANGQPDAEWEGFKKVCRLGWIPEDWETKKIGSIGEIVTGGTPKTSNASYWGDEVVWATPTDVTALSTRFLSGTERNLTEKGLANSAATLLPKKSVIVCTRATIGDAAINNVPAATNQGFKSIVPDDTQVNPDFLYYSIETQKQELKRLGCGSTFLEVSKKDFSNFKLPFPPLREQRRIAAVLAAWDRALAQTDALLDAKERRKKALMQQLLTGKTRLPGFADEGDAADQKPVRSSRPEQVSSSQASSSGPRGWCEKKLGQLFTERKDRDHGDLQLLSVTTDSGVVRRDTLDRRVAPGDIAYNTMRMWQGVSGASRLEGIVSPAYTVCIPSDAIDVDFAAYLFKMPCVVDSFRRYSQGLVSDTLNLRFDHFAEVTVHLPQRIEEQRAIAAVLATCDDEIETLRAGREALERQKKGMMQKLLTGQVRVGEEDPDDLSGLQDLNRSNEGSGGAV